MPDRDIATLGLQRGAHANLESETVDWAVGVLTNALALRGTNLVQRGVEGATLRLHSGTEADSAAASAGVTLPRTAEGFALFADGASFVAWGHDVRGMAYAITELADRVRTGAEGLFGKLPLIEQPSTRIRAVARAFVSEAEDKPWLYDRAQWVEYLDMLAGNRFNRLTINFGIGYDYPYHNNMLSDVYLHFPYPFLFELPEHGVSVVGLSEAERQQNLDSLKFVGREAARRGLDFQLGLWTQRYDFHDAPRANYTINGLKAGPAHAAYCRDSVAFLLREIPQITGLNFRIHVEAGVPEGDYDFWRTVFPAVENQGRTIELNLHAKGLDEHVLGAAQKTGMPVLVAPKYLAEHMGLPYHPSDIRAHEHPPAEAVDNHEKLSNGSRRFTRQSYGDYLPAGRDWGVMFRIWPGTQRVLSGGDPAFAAALGESFSFCDADGFEWMEPMTFKGRQGSGKPGGRSALADQSLIAVPDWKRHEYAYRLYGRLSFSPRIGPESWQRFLAHRLGGAAAIAEQALSAASRILPLVTQAHGPSVANNIYWPEMYNNISGVGEFQKRPYGFDMDGPTRFGNAPTFDPQMFASAQIYVASLFDGTRCAPYSPLDVAHWLDGLASRAEARVAELKWQAAAATPALARYIVDIEIMAALGRFFAQKFRSACYAEVMIATGSLDARTRALAHARLAAAAFGKAADIGARAYQRDIAFGPIRYMRWSWAERLVDVEREVNNLLVYDFGDLPPATHSRGDAHRVIERLASYNPVRRLGGTLETPSGFAPGERLAVRLVADAPIDEAVFYYRHVNHGERWQSVPMTKQGERFVAEVPSAYTDSIFHLQVFATARAADAVAVYPGFPENLAGAPYRLVPQTTG